MASTTFVIVAKGEAASLATLHCSPVFFQIATVQEVNSTMFASGLVVKHCVGIDSFYPLFVSLLGRILSSKREARVLPIMNSRDVYGLWLRLASLRLLRSVR